MPTTNSRVFVDGTSMVNTGITVAVGDTLRFECQGWIDQGWSARIAGRIIVDGAGRNTDGSLNNSSPADSSYPLQSAIRYALIGQIVDPSGIPQLPFFIGKVSGPIPVRVPGTLLIGANDNKPGDNGPASGHRTPWQVSIDRTVPDPPPPPLTPGIRISDIQILQVATPAYSHDTLLVGRKTTVVRAFLDVRAPVAVVRGFVEVNGFKIAPLNPSPAGPDAVVPQVGGAAPDRNQTTASLNFEVPGSILPVDGNFSHHTFRVTAWVGEQDSEPGFFHTDQRTVGFGTGVPMEINLISVIGNDGGDPAGFMGNLSIANMEAQLPVPDGGLVAVPCIPPVVTIPDLGAGNLTHLVNRINAMRLVGSILPDLWGGRDRIVFGMVVPDTTATQAGINVLSSALVRLRPNTDAANGTAGANTTGVHELGHAYGVGHAAGCGSPSGVDPDLPQASNRPGWTTVFHQVVPAGTAANMSYCAMRWRTSTEYLHIYRRLLSNAGVSA